MHPKRQFIDFNYEFINGVSGKYTTEIVSHLLHDISRYLLFTMLTEGDIRPHVFVCTKLWVVLNYSLLQVENTGMSFLHNNILLSFEVVTVTVRTN
jgi:hypothetical protein